MASHPERLAEFPRVLVLSDEGPQTGTAGGLLLHRLFERYPGDRLKVLARYVPTVGDPLPGVEYCRLQTPWRRLENSRFNRLKRSLSAFGMAPQVPPRRILRLLGGFTPDVVFSVMQHAAYYDAAHHFARASRLPLVIAVHDVNEEFEGVLPWASAAARGRDRAFYRYASSRLCISPEMEQLCASLYGVAGTVLYPNRSEALRPRPIALSGDLRRGPGVTLGFAGNLNYGYGEGLLQMLPALRATGTRLVIYGRPPSGAAAPLGDAADCCEFRGFVPSAEAWSSLQRDCDAVWLPYPNPAGNMERLYRYHFPSKLPEYLALGMPVIVSGPSYATGMTWAARNLGRDLCPETVDGLSATLRRMAADSRWRLEAAARCVESGDRDFEPGRIVADFHAHLRSAVSGG